MPPRLQVTLCLKGRSHVDLFDLFSSPINLIPCPNCSALVFSTSLRELPNQLFSEEVFRGWTKLFLFWVTSLSKESNSKNWWFTNHLVRNRLAAQPWDLLINLSPVCNKTIPDLTWPPAGTSFFGHFLLRLEKFQHSRVEFIVRFVCVHSN